jgi:hypothetical protein
MERSIGALYARAARRADLVDILSPLAPASPRMTNGSTKGYPLASRRCVSCGQRDAGVPIVDVSL